ncbi:alpha/beta hydrolase [Actinosynnema sp. NPDC023587]|uniref:alpha/beta fold hydrolase n=1 Tax=Actinosynnema sp. NPDC023587 TaxID=3154695 RepID=UPI0033E6469A
MGDLHTQGVAGLAPVGGGRELHYVELPGPGDDVPTVVFEAGMAATRSYWSLVQPLVARWARAVAYDRAGLGRSAPDSGPRGVDRLAADLNALLDHLGPGPFVLVAHSGGGPVVRVAAADRPLRIAGIVLVDTTDEACDPLFGRTFQRAGKVVQGVSALLARVGLLAFAFRAHVRAFPPDVAAEVRAEAFTPRAMRTRGRELAVLVAATTAFRDRPPVLPVDIPVTSISGVLADRGMSKSVRRAATESHRFRADRSARGRHVLAHASGHNVVITEPGLIADEVRRLLHR